MRGLSSCTVSRIATHRQSALSAALQRALQFFPQDRHGSRRSVDVDDIAQRLVDGGLVASALGLGARAEGVSTSLSGMMVMRVLPGEAMTAPRFALEKSYSLRMGFCLAFACLAGRHDPCLVAARDPHDQQYPAVRVHAQRDVARFAFGIRVFHGCPALVAQRLFDIGEAHTVLVFIRCCFGRIVFRYPSEQYALNMHS